MSTINYDVGITWKLQHNVVSPRKQLLCNSLHRNSLTIYQTYVSQRDIITQWSTSKIEHSLGQLELNASTYNTRKTISNNIKVLVQVETDAKTNLR